jgi:uncharacterized protein YfaS (alpha-2-macroglobulin family)
MNYYKANTDMLSLDGKYLLAVSYAIAGDMSKFNALLPVRFEGEESVPVFGGSFYSPLRDQAIALNALLEVDPTHPQVGTMARYISQQMKVKRYMNTQERAFSFLALGKQARLQSGSNATATIKVGNKTLGKYEGKTLTIDSKDLNGKLAEINVSGDGQLFYFWEVEGISETGDFKQEDSFLKARKTFYDRNGQRLTSLKNVKQNDLIVVEMTIVGPAGSRIENVVLTDILPAGLEIENSRIRSIPDLDWINGADADFADIRDDRIHYFTTVTGNEKKFYYTCRAVSPGRFNMGPVNADAMYNGEYHSYHGGGEIRILPNY